MARIKLSKWAKNNGLSYATAYSMFKRGKLPVKSVQFETGTILVEESSKLMCKVKDINGERSFFVSIDVDIDAYNLEKQDKEEIIYDIKGLARKIAHKIGFKIDENSIKVV